MQTLFEKYRPREWSEVIGQDKAVGKLRGLAGRGLGGRALFLQGKSGVGKTTLAYLAAREVADDFHIQEIDAGKLTLARLSEIESEQQHFGFGKGGRVFIVNEAHGLRKDTIRQLLVMLERLPSHVLWIFTTTNDGADMLFEDCADASPLLSRCIVIALTCQGLSKPFAEHLRRCAIAEGLDGQDIGVYVRLMQDKKNNLRAGFQEVESGRMLLVGGAA